MTDRVRMECPKCGYKCVPQWMNDEAHCLKCQAVLRRRPCGAGAGAGVSVREERRQVGEASTYKHAPGSALESSSGACSRSPDGIHHWKFGKCSYCQASEPPRGFSAPLHQEASLGRGFREEYGGADDAYNEPVERSKICSTCRKPYSGHGTVCSKCRMSTSKRGSSVACQVCGAFFWGFGDTCEECLDPVDYEPEERLGRPPPRGAEPAVPRDIRQKMECPYCGYRCVPQWLNDQAHCLKCQAVLKTQPTVHGGGAYDVTQGQSRRAPGEVSTFKHSAGSAMESSSGSCPRSPDGVHHWKFGKCSYCQKKEGVLIGGAGATANPGQVGRECPKGGKHMYKFSKCSKCGQREC